MHLVNYAMHDKLILIHNLSAFDLLVCLAIIMHFAARENEKGAPFLLKSLFCL
jgi:hypothetical protein